MIKRLLSLLPLTLLLSFLGGGVEANQAITAPITVTNTTTSPSGFGKTTGTGMVLQIDVSAIGAGDTWTFKGQYVTSGGNTVDLTATSANVTAVGLVTLSILSPYTVETSTPLPTQIVATRSVAGGGPTITYRVVGRFNNNQGTVSGSTIILSPTSYISRQTSTGFLQIYVDGALKATVTQNGVIPGACPSDLSSIELGTECFSNGQRVWRDVDGIWKATTTGKRAAS